MTTTLPSITGDGFIDYRLITLIVTLTVIGLFLLITHRRGR